MPAKRFGKYRSRRKNKKGAGLVGDIGRGMQQVGEFTGTTGKKIAEVAAKAAPILGTAIESSGKLLKSKEIQDVGKWTSGAGRDIAKAAVSAAPVVGNITKSAGSWLDNFDPEESEQGEEQGDLGGSLFDSFKFDHGKHAAHVVSQLGNYQHRGIKAAAKHLSGMARQMGDHPILAHRKIANSAKKHFHTIMNSTKQQLQRTLHGGGSGLHRAVSEAIHTAHVGGGIEFGGDLWSDVGKGAARGLSYGGSAAKIVGGATAAAGVVMSVAGMPEFGAPMVAAGGMAYAAGAGTEALGKLAGSDVKTSNVTGKMFVL